MLSHSEAGEQDDGQTFYFVWMENLILTAYDDLNIRLAQLQADLDHLELRKKIRGDLEICIELLKQIQGLHITFENSLEEFMSLANTVHLTYASAQTYTER